MTDGAFGSLISPDRTSSLVTSFRLNLVCCDWLRSATANWVASRRSTQFAVAATDHSALISDEMRSGVMR